MRVLGPSASSWSSHVRPTGFSYSKRAKPSSETRNFPSSCTHQARILLRLPFAIHQPSPSAGLRFITPSNIPLEGFP